MGDVNAQTEVPKTNLFSRFAGFKHPYTSTGPITINVTH